MKKLESEFTHGQFGATRRHHIIREANISGIPQVHSLYPFGSKGRLKAETVLKTLPEGHYEVDFMLGGLYVKDGQLTRHGLSEQRDSKIISDNLPHYYPDINKEARYARSLEEKPTSGELIDLLRDKKPKSVAELRAILPPSITDRLGEGKLGLERTVSMLRNLTIMIVYDPVMGVGTHLNEKEFAECIAAPIYFPDDPYTRWNWGNAPHPGPGAREALISRTLEVQDPMLRLALEGGILEEHQGWKPPGETPDPYRLQLPVQKLLRRIFNH